MKSKRNFQKTKHINKDEPKINKTKKSQHMKTQQFFLLKKKSNCTKKEYVAQILVQASD